MSPQAEIRNAKLKQYVEEALDAGVFYQADLEDRIIPMILPLDEAVDNLIGTFTNPSFQEIRDLEKQVGSLPRGSRALVYKQWNGGSCYQAMFSDGSGGLAVGSAHDSYDAPPSYADLHRRVLCYEIYMMRRSVEAEREQAADLKAIAENGFTLYQTFKDLEFDRRVFTTAQISEIRPDGKVVLQLSRRGSRKRFTATVGGLVLERRIRKAEERAMIKDPPADPPGQTALFIA